LGAAAAGHELLTAPGTNNDALWGELAARGLMEQSGTAGESLGLDWRVWRMTDAGRAAMEAAPPPPLQNEDRSP